jgi:hypothetical protein
MEIVQNDWFWLTEGHMVGGAGLCSGSSHCGAAGTAVICGETENVHGHQHQAMQSRVSI